MLNITSFLKPLVLAFFITCSIILISQYGSPMLSSLRDEAAHVDQKTYTLTAQNVFAPIDLSYKIVNIMHMTNFINAASAQVYNPVKAIKASTSASTPIWIQIGKNLNLDHSAQNPRVKTEIRRILADKQSFQTILNRSAPYIHYIYTQTQLRKLPAEIVLVPIIESEYNPNDHNSIGALGLWQLMPGTARGLGVKMSNGYDGRRNLVDSTKAALTFYTDLKNQFKGNWNLAFAAYNCGPGCVSSAVKKAKSQDFFNLNVPLDTKYYVPRLLAMAILIKHAKEYGITLPSTTDVPYLAKNQPKNSASLAKSAKS